MNTTEINASNLNNTVLASQAAVQPEKIASLLSK
jgi:hypothetical protein